MALKFKGGRAVDPNASENAEFRRTLMMFREATKNYQRELFKAHNAARKQGGSGRPMGSSGLIQQIEAADNAVESLSITLVALTQ